MDHPDWITFPALSALSHRFVLRHPSLSMKVDRQEALERLRPWHQRQIEALGYEVSDLRTAEQVHGSLVVRVDAKSAGLTPAADGLITNDSSVILGVYVADCGAIYLHDTRRHAIGLVHSGKNGTELGIVPTAIQAMTREFGSQASDIVVQVSPCIRPPRYEIDFASGISEQCMATGVMIEHYHDCALCTAQDLERFYSYRAEKGQTGRMLALLSLRRS